jgi:hypothetical protein
MTSSKNSLELIENLGLIGFNYMKSTSKTSTFWAKALIRDRALISGEGPSVVLAFVNIIIK